MVIIVASFMCKTSVGQLPVRATYTTRTPGYDDVPDCHRGAEEENS